MSQNSFLIKQPIPLFQLTLRLLNHLPPSRKKALWVLLSAMAMGSLIEVMTLGGIAFYVSAVSSPSTVLQSSYTQMIATIVGEEFISTPQQLILTLSIAVVLLVIVKNTAQAIIGYQSSRFAALIEGDVGGTMYKGFLGMPLQWIQSQNSADLILSIQWRHYVGSGFIHPWLQAAGEAAVVSALLVAVTVVEPATAFPVMTLFGLLAFLIFTRIKKRLDKHAQSCQHHMGALNRLATRSIHGIKDVKVSGQASFFANHYSEEIYGFARPFSMQQFFQRAPVWILESLGFLILASAVCALTYLEKSSAAGITGVVALLVVTAWRVLPALNRILASFTSLRSSLPYVHSVVSLLETIDEHDALATVGNTVKRIPLKGELRIDNVTFNYGNNATNALSRISLSIKRGETVGVIGASGAGKSTLIDLLIGLLPPDRGHVELDGMILDETSRAGWMQSIGYVPQSPYIHDGTLLENIAFGEPPNLCDRKRSLQCCTMASMDDFLDILPNGLDTPIGERGTRLSGGQRQRVAIARALYQSPDLLVLDEATSSLDEQNEKAIQRTVNSLKHDLTMIIIAHRLTTVADCDTIVWLEKGEIIMTGPPHLVLQEYKRHNESE